MTYFPCQEFVPLLRLLATGDIEENAEHESPDHPHIGTLAAR